jgi:Na+/H+ antiporter NhaD/arsenite permease-like protein
MIEILIAIFVIGYAAIAFEHPLKINKAAPAIITGVLCWTVYILMSDVETKIVEHQLLEFFSEVSSILFFLLAAMTIVELVDIHHGFSVITDKVKTTSKVKLLWIIGGLTFIFSAGLDNLTSSIVMVSLLRKLIADKEERLFYAGIVIIAANAGGAWSPIGDVTTTMLWIGGQITALNIMKTLILPSIVCLVVPLIILSFIMKGNVTRPEVIKETDKTKTISEKEKLIVFIAGVLGLIFVPIFKTITHLPPFMGMLLSLGVLWILTELMHLNKTQEMREKLSVTGAIKKVDIASVLFFLGILVAIGALQSTGVLNSLAEFMDKSIPNQNVVVMTIGLLSSIVDNVPLVAAGMGMYPMPPLNPADIIEGVKYYPQDDQFWEFLAYCAGTGGSALVIGSAAGVAVMGMEKMDFFWYLKKMSLLALIGYISGAITFLFTFQFFIH